MGTRFKHLGAALAIAVLAAAVWMAPPAAAVKRPAKGACAARSSSRHHQRDRQRDRRQRRRCSRGAPKQPAPMPVPVAAPGLTLPAPNAPSFSALPPATMPPPVPGPLRFYSPTSYWNAPVPTTAPIDPESAQIVGAFNAMVASEFQAKTGPSINTTEFSVPVYTVPADQPTVKVALDAQNAPALQEAWSAVPMPAEARPATGSDARLVVWQPSTDKLWDFWRARREEDGWHAAWGGATQNVSTASGLPDPESWPGAQPWWGTSGCSMGIVGGLITFEDLEEGVIDHAMQIAIPNVRAGVWASPALRTDGKTNDPLALPEGAHLRLDPDLDLESMGLPRITLILARAAQRYGIFITNGAKDVSFQAQDPTPTGTEPYRGPGGFWEGSYPRAILSHFPWDHLQLLEMDLHS